MRVYALFRIKPETDDTDESFQIYGVYSTEQHAAEAMKRAVERDDTPRTYHVDGFNLDHTHWSEGFINATVGRG